MVRAIRDAEVALGQVGKVVQAEEEELRAFAQRGIQALRDVSLGEELREDVNIAILRAGNQRKGVHPRYLGEIDKIAKKLDITEIGLATKREAS